MFRRFALACALALSAPSLAEEVVAEPAAVPATTNVLIQTSLGPIVVALETERAPITSANFLRYADEKRFDGTTFYRVLRDEVGGEPWGLVQAGTRGDPKRTRAPIAHEPTSVTGLTHTTGTISMARHAPGTASGDFTIMIGDVSGLDAKPDAEDPDTQAGFAAFGHVVSGMEVVHAIHDSPTDPNQGEGAMRGQLLAEPVKIVSVRRETP